MEYIGHDLKTFMKTIKRPFSTSEVKCLILQLLECVKFLHNNCIIHRGLKTSNLLLNDQGELKIRPHLASKPDIAMVAPEILLGSTQFSTAIDMWAVGCVMAEMITKEPLFDGNTEASQIYQIFRMLGGTPNETIWPGFSLLPRANKIPLLSDAGFDLLNKFLTYDPDKRITADAALSHEWFREFPLPTSKENMPLFPKKQKQLVIGSGDTSVEAQIY
ncbi:hypothetical protein H5410_026382 [Solanum commersonii]|uniref:Protein kinase domain-containing protein n=1 Tax=Solanum commersonii TaxID=4109 RepID=A0A9J5YWW6_SOLCO|nr:hypothetical protein H5410_026382 [Solanum commersonii]